MSAARKVLGVTVHRDPDLAMADAIAFGTGVFLIESEGSGKSAISEEVMAMLRSQVRLPTDAELQADFSRFAYAPDPDAEFAVPALPCIPDSAPAPVIDWMHRPPPPLSIRLVRAIALVAVLAVLVAGILS